MKRVQDHCQSASTFAAVKAQYIIQPYKCAMQEKLHNNSGAGLQINIRMQKQNATLATEQEQLTQRIQYTDNAINQHVYTLYGLTADEIKIVERGVVQIQF